MARPPAEVDSWGELAVLLEKIRDEKEVSVKSLLTAVSAHALGERGISRAHFYRIRSGAYLPSKSVLVALLQRLDVPETDHQYWIQHVSDLRSKTQSQDISEPSSNKGGASGEADDDVKKEMRAGEYPPLANVTDRLVYSAAVVQREDGSRYVQQTFQTGFSFSEDLEQERRVYQHAILDVVKKWKLRERHDALEISMQITPTQNEKTVVLELFNPSDIVLALNLPAGESGRRAAIRRLLEDIAGNLIKIREVSPKSIEAVRGSKGIQQVYAYLGFQPDLEKRKGVMFDGDRLLTHQQELKVKTMKNVLGP